MALIFRGFISPHFLKILQKISRFFYCHNRQAQNTSLLVFLYIQTTLAVFQSNLQRHYKHKTTSFSHHNHLNIPFQKLNHN